MADPALRLLPRTLGPSIDAALATFPVVVLIGARQTGKSTLVRDLHPGDGRLYLTLDDIDVRADADQSPDELLRRAPRMTIDEVQRSPDLLLAIKRAVDSEWVPGRFVLTGSANLLLMKRVSESLAGRASYLTLWPLTRREQLGLGAAGGWDLPFSEPVSRWREAILDQPIVEEDWEDLARRGGYPVAAHRLHDEHTRRLWFDGYVRTYLERDLQELSAIEHLADFRRLMRALCLRLGGLLNQADVARDVGLPPSTVQRYVNLLEVSFQLVRLAPYSVNRGRRLVKSPKVYWCDTGLALFLSGETEPRGAHLENLVLTDLLAWRERSPDRPEILYWRTHKGTEVDFVLERGGTVLPIEVKATARPRSADVRHLRTFMHEYADRTEGALLLHAGTETFWIADRILAVPWWRIV